MALKGRLRGADENDPTANSMTDARGRQAVAERALEQAELAQWSPPDFVAGAAHDLRPHLTAPSGFTQLLARRDISRDVGARAPTTIERNQLHLDPVSDDVVDAGPIGARSFEVRPRPIALAALARRRVEAKQATTDRDWRLPEGPDHQEGSGMRTVWSRS